MTDVHHCPRCELRFGNRAELVDHLVVDHGFAADGLEQTRYRTSLPDEVRRGRQCLVVGNQAIGHPEVLAAIRDRLEHGVTRFLVVVPATALAEQWLAPGEDHLAGGSGGGAGTVDAAVALAEARLRALLDVLAAEGCEAQGRVGPADPELAVRALLREQQVDEILVATLPAGISRWLGIDLPDRLRRRYGLPVTTVEMPPARATSERTRRRRARTASGSSRGT